MRMRTWRSAPGEKPLGHERDVRPGAPAGERDPRGHRGIGDTRQGGNRGHDARQRGVESRGAAVALAARRGAAVHTPSDA